MKKIVTHCLPLWIMLLTLTFLGAMPLLSDIYANDHASCVTKSQESFINDTSNILKEATGVQVIVLTVDSLDGASAADYARVTLEQFGEIYTSEDAVFLLVSTGDSLFYSLPTGKAADAVQEVEIVLEGRDFSTPLYEAYKSAVRAVYTFSGADPGEELSAALEPGARPSSEGVRSGTAIGTAIAIFLAVSGFRTARKNQQRDGKFDFHERRRTINKFRDFDEDDSMGMKGYDD